METLKLKKNPSQSAEVMSLDEFIARDTRILRQKLIDHPQLKRFLDTEYLLSSQADFGYIYTPKKLIVLIRKLLTETSVQKNFFEQITPQKFNLGVERSDHQQPNICFDFLMNEKKFIYFLKNIIIITKSVLWSFVLRLILNNKDFDYSKVDIKYLTQKILDESPRLSDEVTRENTIYILAFKKNLNNLCKVWQLGISWTNLVDSYFGVDGFLKGFLAFAKSSPQLQLSEGFGTGCVYSGCFESFFSCNKAISCISYPFENQRWERAFLDSVNKHNKSVKIIAHQHSYVRCWDLRYYLGVEWLNYFVVNGLDLSLTVTDKFFWQFLQEKEGPAQFGLKYDFIKNTKFSERRFSNNGSKGLGSNCQNIDHGSAIVIHVHLDFDEEINNQLLVLLSDSLKKHNVKYLLDFHPGCSSTFRGRVGRQWSFIRDDGSEPDAHICSAFSGIIFECGFSRVPVGLFSANILSSQIEDIPQAYASDGTFCNSSQLEGWLINLQRFSVGEMKISINERVEKHARYMEKRFGIIGVAREQ